MTPARWPDMPFDRRWDNARWRAAAEGTRYGVMVDSGLADSQVDWTGAMAILNVGSWQTFRRRIVKHGAGEDRFAYPADPGHRLAKEKPHPVGMDRYCLYGFQALDHPGEWFYDKTERLLYLWPPGNRKASALQVETKVMAVALVAENIEHVIVSGLDFHATTFQFKNVRHCILEDVHLTYPNTLVAPFASNPEHPAVTDSLWSTVKWFGESSVDALTLIQGEHNTIRDSTIQRGEGPAITLSGRHNRIENNHFFDFDWHGLDYGYGIDLLAAADATVHRLTLHHFGGSEGIRLANHGKSLVEYSYIHHGGLRQSDGALIQTSTPNCAGTVIRYNWLHDHNAFHWGGNGIRGDDLTRGLIVHHNVVWNCREKGIVVKGDGNLVAHNTCFDNPVRDILLPRNRLPGKPKELKEQNRTSKALNNLGGVLGNWRWEQPDQPPYGL
ncbi:MAG: right-handed parallel beta-helix repeat-containing protein, partial [Verrucomicrobiota bacterium]